MFSVQALMHDLNIVDEADEHVGFELRDLVEVKRAEETVAPAKSRVRVHDHIWMIACRYGVFDHIFERRAAQGGEPRDRQVENAAWANIGSFRVHQVAEVEEPRRFTRPSRRFGDRLQVGFLVDADLACDDCTHSWGSNGVREHPSSKVRAQD